MNLIFNLYICKNVNYTYNISFKIMELISMVDFVLSRDMAKSNSENALCEIEAYANFLKKSLKLEMFVPCDEDENVLEKPLTPTEKTGSDELDSQIWAGYQYEIDKYNEAKSRVLLQGIGLYAAKFHIKQNRNIEYLSKFGTLELTESAIRQLGL